MDLVAIGEGMVELAAEGADFGSANLFRRGFAGDVVNTLIHASRNGMKVGLVSRIGDDEFAPGLTSAWEAEGLDLSHAPIVSGKNGIYFIINNTQGERRFVYRREGSAASTIGPQDLDGPFLENARYVLVTGITQAISKSAQSLVSEVARMALAGSRGVFDPNYRQNLWATRGGVATARKALAEVAPHMRWVLPSFPDDLVVVGALPSMAPRDALARFAELGGADVAMKLGRDGVLLSVAGEVTHVPAQPVETVVDTTGAGDAWNAAFLANLIRGHSPVMAAGAANRYAAGILEHRGAIPPKTIVPCERT